MARSDFIAKKVVLEISEKDIEHVETFFVVNSKMTIGDVMSLAGLTGSQAWHFNEGWVELRLRKHSGISESTDDE